MPGALGQRKPGCPGGVASGPGAGLVALRAHDFWAVGKVLIPTAFGGKKYFRWWRRLAPLPGPLPIRWGEGGESFGRRDPGRPSFLTWPGLLSFAASGLRADGRWNMAEPPRASPRRLQQAFAEIENSI